jgi:hypothetical protein
VAPMNWGDWIREGLELEPIGEAMTVLLDQDCRRVARERKGDRWQRRLARLTDL